MGCGGTKDDAHTLAGLLAGYIIILLPKRRTQSRLPENAD